MGTERKHGETSLLAALGLAVLCLLVVAAVGSYRVLADRWSSPAVCGSCHEMRPAYAAWEVSSHSRVDCLQCHQEVNLVPVMGRYATGRYRRPIEARAVPDATCRGCHTPSREVTPPSGLETNHAGHLEQGIPCARCHTDAAHPEKVAVTAVATATGVASRIPLARVPMDRCLSCHNGTMAPKTCTTCHPDKGAPASHLAAGWETGHGRSARQDLAGCNSCHQYDPSRQARFEPGSGPGDLVTFARETPFCADCHVRRPVTHRSGFVVYHSGRAGEGGDGCLICHDREPSVTASTPATSIACNQCHYTRHPANWVYVHKSQVTDGRVGECFNCHGAGGCTSCHGSAAFEW